MTARTTALALVLSALMVPAAGQGVHRWVDERGVVQYGDRPAPGASRLRVRSESATAPGGAPPVAAAAAPLAAGPAAAATGAPPLPRVSRPAAAAAPTSSTVDRLLSSQRTAADAPLTGQSPGMAALIAQCKANRGVDCDTPQGMRNLQRENTPITREEQARIAGLRARRANCARAPGALGC